MISKDWTSPTVFQSGIVTCVMEESYMEFSVAIKKNKTFSVSTGKDHRAIVSEKARHGIISRVLSFCYIRNMYMEILLLEGRRNILGRVHKKQQTLAIPGGGWIRKLGGHGKEETLTNGVLF